MQGESRDAYTPQPYRLNRFLEYRTGGPIMLSKKEVDLFLSMMCISQDILNTPDEVLK